MYMCTRLGASRNRRSSVAGPSHPGPRMRHVQREGEKEWLRCRAAWLAVIGFHVSSLPGSGQKSKELTERCAAGRCSHRAAANQRNGQDKKKERDGHDSPRERESGRGGGRWGHGERHKGWREKERRRGRRENEKERKTSGPYNFN